MMTKKKKKTLENENRKKKQIIFNLVEQTMLDALMLKHKGGKIFILILFLLVLLNFR